MIHHFHVKVLLNKAKNKTRVVNNNNNNNNGFC